MPSLLLQKPPMNFKTKEHLRELVRGMQSCLKGDFVELLHEEKIMQKNYKKQSPEGDIGKISHEFAVLMKRRSILLLICH